MPSAAITPSTSVSPMSASRIVRPSERRPESGRGSTICRVTFAETWFRQAFGAAGASMLAPLAILVRGGRPRRGWRAWRPFGARPDRIRPHPSRRRAHRRRPGDCRRRHRRCGSGAAAPCGVDADGRPTWAPGTSWRAPRRDRSASEPADRRAVHSGRGRRRDRPRRRASPVGPCGPAGWSGPGRRRDHARRRRWWCPSRSSRSPRTSSTCSRPAPAVAGTGPRSPSRPRRRPPPPGGGWAARVWRP